MTAVACRALQQNEVHAAGKIHASMPQQPDDILSAKVYIFEEEQPVHMPPGPYPILTLHSN